MRWLFYSLFLLMGIWLLVAFRHPVAANNQPVGDNLENDSIYLQLPGSTNIIGISADIGDTIRKLISTCDAEFWLEGRKPAFALDPLIDIHVLQEAMEHGGQGSGITYFDDFWFDDIITVDVDTKYDKKTLIFREKEGGWYYYTANLKFTYSVYVDGTYRQGVYYDSNRIATHIPITAQP